VPSVTTLVTISHQDYRHLGSKAISEMGRRKAVIRLPVSEERSCNETLSTGSTRGKFDRKPYRPSGRKATNILEKFHIGIEGPMEVSIIGGFNYFLILVEDCSGYITVFVIQAKSQALQHYTTFRDQVWSQLYRGVCTCSVNRLFTNPKYKRSCDLEPPMILENNPGITIESSNPTRLCSTRLPTT